MNNVENKISAVDTAAHKASVSSDTENTESQGQFSLAEYYSEEAYRKRMRYLNDMLRKKRRKTYKITAVIVAFAIAFTSVFGVVTLITKGEKINCKKAAEEYNSNRSDSSEIYVDATKQQLSAEMDELEGLIVQLISQLDIEAMLYSDEGVSLIGRLLGQYSGKAFDEVSFSALKKVSPEAYSALSDMQKASASWEDIELIPFGIEKGNKEDFIEACGAFGDFLGNEMLSMFMKAPSAYDDALVPILESLHTGSMPSLFGFVMKTGLSGAKRVEFLVEKALSLIEPLKSAPLTYLCGILPDFIANYQKASAFINSKEIGLTLPSIEEIIDSLWNLIGISYEPLDLEYIKGLGEAAVTKSGRSGGKRVEITGDRDDIFIYIGYYISKHLSLADAYPAFEELITTSLKKLDRNSEAGRLLYSDLVNKIIGVFVNIYALNKPKATSTDAEVLVNEHNALNKDFSEVFSTFMSEESVAKLIDTIDSLAVSFFSENSLEKMLYTDAVASFFCKFISEFCSIDFADIPFDAMKYQFSEAYNYIKALQSENKTWADVGVIPFGIEPGDEQAFIKACGAGAEYFGDLLALDMVISPTTYDEALVTITESLHATTAPDVKEFIFMHGADGAKRVEIILEMLLKIIEPLKEAPLSYLCTMLPDLIYSYGVAADCYAANPAMALTGFELLPLNELLNKVVSGSGITLGEYDFSQIIALSEASVAESGDRTGKRMRLDGDREAVFAALMGYIKTVLNSEDNVKALAAFASNVLGISPAVISGMLSTFKLILG
ncbi:MAG: hypothetical protein IKJ27_11615 [Clostridia bacterium]|nr:hypothetical protein [Clostridia bacterium]